MAKTAKKATKKTSGATVKPIARSSKTLPKTQKPSVVSTSKTGPAMTGEQVEKELAMAHKVLAGAMFQINYMLTTRRVSPKRIAEATQRTADAAAYMLRLQKAIQTYAQAG